MIEWLIATLPLLQLSKDNSGHNMVDLHYIQTDCSSKRKKKNQYNTFISAEGAELPVSCWPSVGLYTLSSLNDRRCKYALTLCQAEAHPGDTPTQWVCVRERLTAKTRVERSRIKVKDAKTLWGQKVVKRGKKVETQRTRNISAPLNVSWCTVFINMLIITRSLITVDRAHS